MNALTIYSLEYHRENMNVMRKCYVGPWAYLTSFEYETTTFSAT
jgi:hypothetical protein